MIQKDIKRLLNNIVPIKTITSAVGTTTIYQYPKLTITRTRVASKDFYSATYKHCRLAEEDAKKLFKEVEYGLHWR